MQQTWVVGVGVVCLSLVAIADGLVSPGAKGTIRSMVEAAEPVRLDPVVVTGTQIAVPVSELPSAITVIDREEIDSRQSTDVLQLLRTVPGLSLTQIGSRGGATSVFPRGGNANFNLVLVDGVPVNNAGGGSGPGPNFLNIHEAESSGIEAGFQLLLPWQLRLDGSYTFLETKVIDDGGIGGTFFPPGQPLLRRPKHQGSVGLTYLGQRWTVAFIANVVGPAIDRDFSQLGSPRVTLPGHTKLDLAASYAVVQNIWGLKNLRVKMKIDNLLDESYEEALGFSAAGISVRGGIAASF